MRSCMVPGEHIRAHIRTPRLRYERSYMVHKAHIWSASLIHEAIRSLERWIADCDNQNMAALQREKGKREDHRSQWKDL